MGCEKMARDKEDMLMSQNNARDYCWLIGDDRLHGVVSRGDKYVLGDGGYTDVWLMYVDVGGHEMGNSWNESIAHESLMLMWSKDLEHNDLL
jgi:hypothetical protein